MRVNINSIRNEIPIYVLFRALGVTSDKEIIELVSGVCAPMGIVRRLVESEMIGSIVEGQITLSERDAIMNIAKHVMSGSAGSFALRNKTPSQQRETVRTILRMTCSPILGSHSSRRRPTLRTWLGSLLGPKTVSRPWMTGIATSTNA